MHLSSSDALPMIASARGDGVRLTAETCPHYLTLTADEIADGATAAKCSPPVREAANRELLWAGLRDQVLGMVVSDHSPCTAVMKELGARHPVTPYDEPTLTGVVRGTMLRGKLTSEGRPAGRLLSRSAG